MIQSRPATAPVCVCLYVIHIYLRTLHTQRWKTATSLYLLSHRYMPPMHDTVEASHSPCMRVFVCVCIHVQNIHTHILTHATQTNVKNCYIYLSTLARSLYETRVFSPLSEITLACVGQIKWGGMDPTNNLPVMHSVYRNPGKFLLTSVFIVHLHTNIVSKWLHAKWYQQHGWRGSFLALLFTYPGRIAKRNCVIMGGNIMKRRSMTSAASPLIKGGRASL